MNKLFEKLKIIAFSLVITFVFIYPFVAKAFSYQGEKLEINFDGNAIFTDTTLLYPGGSVCKNVFFKNLSSEVQPLGFASIGFNSSQMFDYFIITVKDNDHVFIDKSVKNLSSDIDQSELITNLAVGENKSINFCVFVKEDMGDFWQGKTAGPVTFVFGFDGEEVTPPVSVFGADDLAGLTESGDVSGETFSTIDENEKPSLPKNADKNGTVAGETNNQNMCCNWDWCCILPWILVAILLLWLIWMWASDRKRRQEKEEI
ncbi:MAG: hypothetical protein PHW50_01010 [Patescibacteria group bacterium]|nr:hypothetical protein [Patescibacteria group bacterium]